MKYHFRLQRYTYHTGGCHHASEAHSLVVTRRMVCNKTLELFRYKTTEQCVYGWQFPGIPPPSLPSSDSQCYARHAGSWRGKWVLPHACNCRSHVQLQVRIHIHVWQSQDLVIAQECFTEVTLNFLCLFMNDFTISTRNFRAIATSSPDL